MTAESEAELLGINGIFANRVTVRNYNWHKMLTFEKNLVKPSNSLATKVLYAINETECVNFLSFSL